jgi:hypothetical protein
MQPRLARVASLAILLAGTLLFQSVQAAAPDELRIETKVYAGREEEPVSENLTLFHAGAVYDFLPDTREVTVFDPRGGRFRLIDPVRKQQAEIETREIDEFCKGLKRWSAEQNDALLKFAARPEFDVQFNESTGELRLDHKLLKYFAVTGRPRHSAVLPQYRLYCDGYARLGAMLHPGSIPPFVRQQLNAELAARGLVAESIELTLEPREPLGKPLVMRSAHKIAYRLIDSDRKRISQTNDQMANLPTVDWHEYRQALNDAE